MQGGDQRHQKMVRGQAAQQDDEPALRKIRNIEGADQHQSRQDKYEKDRQQPIYVDGSEAKKSCHAESKSSMRS